MNILDDVKKAICKILPGVDESKIVPQAMLKEDLQIDSLDRVELALAMEDMYNIYLQDEDLTEIKSVADVISTIEYKLKVKAGA